MSYLSSTFKSRRQHKRSRKLSIALACGIIVGINASPYLLHVADTAGITLPQTWTENTDTRIAMSEVLDSISQSETATSIKNALTHAQNTSLTHSKKIDDVDKAAKIKQLQAILDGGMAQNFTTSTDTFYVPLEGHTAPSGMTLIGVRGTFVTASAGQNLDTAITHINKIRKDAYNSGLVDRYVPISRAPALERTAQIRAVEATVYPTHTRPNGKDSSTLKAEGFAENGLENLAWGGRTLHAAIDQWAAEKQNYINAKNGKKTGEAGHYATMIDPNNIYVGLGMFTYSSGYGTTISGIFSSSNPSGPSTLLSGPVIQGIYVPTSAVSSSPEFTLQSSSIGSKAVFSASTKVLNAQAILEAEIKK